MSVKSFLTASGGSNFSYPEVPTAVAAATVATAATASTTAAPTSGPRQSKWLTRSTENATNNDAGAVAGTSASVSTGGSGVVLQPQFARPQNSGVTAPNAPPSGPINAALFLSNLKQQQQTLGTQADSHVSPPSHPGFPANVTYSMIGSPAVPRSSESGGNGSVGLVSASKGKFSQPSVYSSGAR